MTRTSDRDLVVSAATAPRSVLSYAAAADPQPRSLGPSVIGPVADGTALTVTGCVHSPAVIGSTSYATPAIAVDADASSRADWVVTIDDERPSGTALTLTGPEGRTLSTVVPVIAVQQSDQGAFVYVVKDGGKATKVPVKVATTKGDKAVITDGIKPGDHVVIEGQLRLTDGAPVKETVGSKKTADAGATP